MIPECCKNCKERNGCDKTASSCARWRAWFRKAWAAIQADARQVIANREERKKEALEECASENRSEPTSSGA